jgi:hypothetical protein
MTPEQRKAAAEAFLATPHQRAGRPHPNPAQEARCAARDAGFVRYHTEHGGTDSATYVWYHRYAVHS